MLIVTISLLRTPAGRLPDACRTSAGRQPDVLEPEFHGARTRWIRGFMAFRLARRARSVMLMMPVCPESRFLGRAARAAAR